MCVCMCVGARADALACIGICMCMYARMLIWMDGLPTCHRNAAYNYVRKCPHM